MTYGNWFHLGLSLLTLFVAIVTITLHLLAWFPTDVTKDLFSSARVDTLLIRGQPILAADWLGWLWAGLYAYQIIMCVYAASIFCRPRDVQRPLRHAIHPTVLLAYCLGLLFTVAWLFIAEFSGEGDSHYFSGLALLGAAITVHVAYSIAIGTGRRAKTSLLLRSHCDVIMGRMLIYNCLAAHASWLLVSVFLDVARVLGHYTVLPLETIQYMWLGAVTGYVFMFFLIEVACSKNALEYTVTPYAIGLIVFGSVIVNDQRLTATTDVSDDVTSENVTLFVTIALMCLIGLLFFIAMGVVIRKSRHAHDEESDENAPLKKITNLSTDVIRVNNMVSYEAEPKKYFDQNENYLYKKK